MNRRVAMLLWALAVGPPGQACGSDIVSYAFVGDDGTLRVAGHTIHLYGIYIPPTDDTCRTFETPIKCAPRAALALDFKIGSRFVHCDPVARNPDGSLEASCRVDGEDLSEWLLMQGWAVARPDAPFEYVVLEEIARERNLGIWGIPVDVIRPQPRRKFP